jgi:hypothetical protein
MGEATASTGRRYQKALHNHPRKLIGTKRRILTPSHSRTVWEKSRSRRSTGGRHMNVWPVKILWHVIHRRRIRVRRRTRSAVVWDEDNARRGLGKRRSRSRGRGLTRKAPQYAFHRWRLRIRRRLPVILLVVDRYVCWCVDRYVLSTLCVRWWRFLIPRQQPFSGSSLLPSASVVLLRSRALP